MQLIQLSFPMIVSVCLGATGAVLANMISFIMIGKINEKVPENERMSYIGSGTNVRQRFKQLYPGNKLLYILNACIAMMVLAFIVSIKFFVLQ